jgi:hypothetical protein
VTATIAVSLPAAEAAGPHRHQVDEHTWLAFAAVPRPARPGVATLLTLTPM